MVRNRISNNLDIFTKIYKKHSEVKLRPAEVP